MNYPTELTVCAKGKVEIKPKLNVSFEREISAVIKIKTSGSKVDLYVNDYRLCYKLLEFKDVEEIGYKGKLQVKSFVYKGNVREPRAGSSLRVYVTEMTLYRTKNNKIESAFYKAGDNLEGADYYKFSLLKTAYNSYETDQVIRGKSNPEVVYEEIQTLVTRLNHEKIKAPPKRNIEQLLNTSIERKRKFASLAVEHGVDAAEVGAVPAARPRKSQDVEMAD